MKYILSESYVRIANTVCVRQVLNKGIYCAKDLYRLSKYYNLPFGLHRDYVQWVLSRSTIHAQRFLCAIDMHHPQYLEAVSR